LNQLGKVIKYQPQRAQRFSQRTQWIDFFFVNLVITFVSFVLKKSKKLSAYSHNS